MPCTKLPSSALANKAAIAALCSAFILDIGTTNYNRQSYNNKLRAKALQPKLRAEALQPCSDVHKTLPDSCAHMGKPAVPETLHSSNFQTYREARMQI